jgi:prephenate dehydrogenase
LAVLGVGLIGGSIGLAARRLPDTHVVGYDPDERVPARALELGVLDETASDVAGAVAGADVVFVATPVGACAETVRAALAAAGRDCAVSDVGSTKRQIAQAIDDPRFVGGHPLAGAETAGVENARADLFDGATWYLTPSAGLLPSLERDASPAIAAAPTSANSAPALERLRALIERLGARPVRIDPVAHDHLMASVSHLQHVFANVLVAQVNGVVESLDGIGIDEGTLGAGPSFRDATRVAGANTAIWTDIYMSNRDELIAAIDDATERLRDVREALERGDAGALAQWNERARAERERLQRTGLTARS